MGTICSMLSDGGIFTILDSLCFGLMIILVSAGNNMMWDVGLM